jgi:hypothetical protein
VALSYGGYNQRKAAKTKRRYAAYLKWLAASAKAAGGGGENEEDRISGMVKYSIEKHQ